MVSSVAYSPDGKHIVSGSGGTYDQNGKPVPVPGEVKVWDAATGKERFSIKGNTGFVLCVAYSLDGNRIVSGSGRHDRNEKPLPGEVKVWDAATGKEVLSLQGCKSWMCTSVQRSARTANASSPGA